ncbi:MAG: curli biogenesis system outer membrane secretion channel CsgG [Desulforhopalus sp.]|jgi:curli biogenesis system outer membrane secretion channel CsgG
MMNIRQTSRTLVLSTLHNVFLCLSKKTMCLKALTPAYFSFTWVSLLGLALAGGALFGNVVAANAANSGAVSIAVLSHTDFLPDATGVYDRRSWNGRDKNPAFAANNDLRTGKDQAYDNVDRPQGYEPESVGLPEILADAILEQLTKSKRFTPVERKTLRTAVLEQRFGKEITASYLDRTLDKAIQDMDTFEIGGGIAMGHATSGAKYNDLLHDFKDLGSAIGANYLVLGNLHQLGSSTETTAVPLSESGRTVTSKTAEARLRLRVIDATTSTVVGADSLQLKVSSMLFQGGKESRDDFEFMNQVSKQAANKILDIIFPAKVVSLDPVVISRGTNDGIGVGDRFSIIREGKEIKESSGTVIARVKSEIGVVQVVNVQDTIAIVDIENGEGITPGDLAVRSTTEPSVAPAASTVPLVANQATVRSLPRVAIGLVKAGSTAMTGPDAGKHAPLFTDTIITRLVQSKRFTVIDRQEVDQLLNEQTAQALAENKDLPSVMGALKGCDYLVIGALQNFSIEKQTITLPNSSRVMTVLDGFAEGNMRIVDAKSGDIMESRKVSVQTQLDIQAGEDRVTATLADSFAAKVVANLLNAVYPIKVAAVVPGGTVYVNRGMDGLLSKGALLDVIQAGQKVIDPDTGVELGVVETKIGQVELVSVEENRSIGNIREGSDFQPGDLLKVIPSEDKQAAGSPTKRSGGSITGGSSSPVQTSNPSPQVKGKATIALAHLTLNARKKFNDSSKVSVIQEGTMDQLTDIMADSLDKTNRFTMMERREVDQLIDEKAFQAIAQGGDIRAYLTELKGADYLVVGELTNFYLYITKKKVAYLDEIQVDYTGFIEGNHRIVDSHTGEIVATDKIRIKKKFKNIGIEEIRTQLIDQYTMEAADGIVLRIYPMRVLGVMPDGTLFINRGADANLKVGSTFTVQRPGQELIDKDTGVSFGTADLTIGEIEITQIEPARSRATLVEGEMPLAGDILRNMAPVQPKPKQKMKVSW